MQKDTTLTATLREGWWEPLWKDGMVAVPLSRNEANALYALINEWVESKRKNGGHAIEALAGHASGDVEAVILKMGAALRSMTPARR
jgi:hypothetical protein